jgi:anti-sigma B factor antagonist
MTAPSLQRALFPPLPGREHGDVTVLSLCGDLDVSDAPALHAWLRGVRRRPRSVVDLTGLAFIDCACLGVLIRHAGDIRARGGTLALAGPQGAVLRILSATGLLGWFEVYDTIGQATTGGAGYQSLTFPAPPARSSPAGAFSDPAGPP